MGAPEVTYLPEKNVTETETHTHTNIGLILFSLSRFGGDEISRNDWMVCYS